MRSLTLIILILIGVSCAPSRKPVKYTRMSTNGKVLNAPKKILVTYRYSVGDSVCIGTKCKLGLINECIDYINTPKYTVSFLDKRGAMHIEYYKEDKLSPYIKP